MLMHVRAIGSWPPNGVAAGRGAGCSTHQWRKGQRRRSLLFFCRDGLRISIAFCGVPLQHKPHLSGTPRPNKVEILHANGCGEGTRCCGVECAYGCADLTSVLTVVPLLSALVFMPYRSQLELTHTAVTTLYFAPGPLAIRDMGPWPPKTNVCAPEYPCTIRPSLWSLRGRRRSRAPCEPSRVRRSVARRHALLDCITCVVRRLCAPRLHGYKSAMLLSRRRCSTLSSKKPKKCSQYRRMDCASGRSSSSMRPTSSIAAIMWTNQRSQKR